VKEISIADSPEEAHFCGGAMPSLDLDLVPAL